MRWGREATPAAASLQAQSKMFARLNEDDDAQKGHSVYLVRSCARASTQWWRGNHVGKAHEAVGPGAAALMRVCVGSDVEAEWGVPASETTGDEA